MLQKNISRHKQVCGRDMVHVSLIKSHVFVAKKKIKNTIFLSDQLRRKEGGHAGKLQIKPKNEENKKWVESRASEDRVGGQGQK